MSPEEDRTRDSVDSEPKHYQLSYSGPDFCLSVAGRTTVQAGLSLTYTSMLLGSLRRNCTCSRVPCRSRPNCHNNLQWRWVTTLSGYAGRSMRCAGHSQEKWFLTGAQAGRHTRSSLSDDRYVLIRPWSQ